MKTNILDFYSGASCRRFAHRLARMCWKKHKIWSNLVLTKTYCSFAINLRSNGLNIKSAGWNNSSTVETIRLVAFEYLTKFEEKLNKYKSNENSWSKIIPSLRIIKLMACHSNIRKTKAWSVRLWKNNFCRLNIDRAIALQSPPTFQNYPRDSLPWRGDFVSQVRDTVVDSCCCVCLKRRQSLMPFLLAESFLASTLLHVGWPSQPLSRWRNCSVSYS